MKKLLVLLPLLTTVALQAQTTTLSPFLTNSLAANLASTDLAPLLANLENNLLQILPTLAAVNNSFDIVQAGTVAGTNGLSGIGARGATTATATSTGGGNNFSGLSSSSLATAQGTSLGQDLSSIIGGRGTALSPASPALTATTSGSATTAGSTSISGGFAGLFGTNTFGFTNTRDALRALLVLQADVERMLPIVDAINGARLSTINATNNNLTMPTLGNSSTATGTALTPTGR
jgi:hypothetical protein